MSNGVRLMSPWFRDFFAATDDGVVRKPEVRKKFVPHGDVLHDPQQQSYREAVQRLLDKSPDAPARVTREAGNVLTILTLEPSTVAARFSPQIHNVGYAIGMGVQPPEGVYGGPAINMNLQFPFIEVKPTFDVQVDERAKRITVFVEGTSPTLVYSRAASRPMDVQIPITRPSTPGATYELVVRDGNAASPSFGDALAREKFVNALPA